MIPQGFALNLRGAEALSLAAAGVGAYGVVRRVEVGRGLYLLLTDGVVGVRDAQGGAMRVDTTDGTKLEVHVTESMPLPVLITSGVVLVAARDGACVLQVVPLVPISDEAREFVARTCRG